MTQRSPRVLHVCTIDGSLQGLLRQQIDGARDLGYDVHLASAPGEYADRLTEAGFHHHALEHSTRRWAPWADVLTARDFGRLIKRLQPDIVHLHTPKPGVYGRIIGRLSGVPLVVNTVHGLYVGTGDPWPKKAVVLATEGLAARFSHVELFQSDDDRRRLRRWSGRSRSVLLGNGIDLRTFRPPTEQERASARTKLAISDNEVIFLIVGRLVAAKGYPDLLEALALLSSDLSIRVLAAGNADVDKGDSLDAAFRSRAEAAGMRFLGVVDDMHSLYAAADVVVLPSHREGMPRSLMEAAAMALPVIATDIPGCRAVVEPGQTGLIVPVAAPQPLADAMRSLAEDATLRASLGRNGADKAITDFNGEVQVKRIDRVYREGLERRRRGRRSS